MDLHDCDVKTMQSKEELKKYIINLCYLLKMKRFGKIIIKYFGANDKKTAGFSIIQLIETSSIIGHFSDYFQKIYLNIFSCKTFDQKLVEEFTQNFFNAKKIRTLFLIRR